jgi:hypothetical protein
MNTITKSPIVWIPTPKTEFLDKASLGKPAAKTENGFLLDEPVDFRTCSVTGKESAVYDAYRIHNDSYEKSESPVTIAEFLN